MAKRKQGKKKKNKITLFQALFAPVDELEPDDGGDGYDAYDDADGYDDGDAYGDGDWYDDGAPEDDGSSIDENGELIHLFDDEEVEYSEQQDMDDADSLVWEDGERVVTDYDPLPDAEAPQDARYDDRERFDAAPLPEEIDLFDGAADDGGSTGRFSGRTRIFRTGASTTARININETQTIRAVDEVAKKRRAREAQKQHEIYVERKKRKQKRLDFIKRSFMNILFATFIVGAVIAALYYTFLLSDIVVDGNSVYSKEYIVELSGLKYGTHLLLCDLDAAKTNIEDDPYLQVDSISYIFPSRIRIDLTERKEAAGIIGLDYNVIIDDSGYVLSMSGGTDLSGLLQVTGISMTGFQLGQRIGEGSDFGTATLISLIEKLEEYELMGSIKSIDMTTPLAIVMYDRDNLKIHLGQPTDLDTKFASLQKLLPSFLAKSVHAGTLYLSAKGGTVYSPVDEPLTTNTTADPGVTPDPNATTDPNVTPDPNATTDPNAIPIAGATPAPPTPSPSPTPDPMTDPFQG